MVTPSCNFRHSICHSPEPAPIKKKNAGFLNTMSLNNQVPNSPKSQPTNTPPFNTLSGRKGHMCETLVPHTELQ